jgi:hypothetical protein
MDFPRRDRNKGEQASPIINEPDYYLENGNMVFTAAYLLKRGYCCKNGCRHCPYGVKTKINR